MPNPYNSQAISGYNTNPPADDGSEVATNALKWSNHKTKLADPIKTLSEAINTELLAAFAKVHGNTFISKSTDYTVVSGDQGAFISVTGTTTITLLAVATAGDGFPLVIFNSGVAKVTIDGNASETINGSTSIELFEGEYALLTCDGSSWAAAGTFSVTGTFTPTYTGFSVDPTGNCDWMRRGNTVYVLLPDSTGTSDATGFTITNVPSAIQAEPGIITLNGMTDNGSQGWGHVQINQSAVWRFQFQSTSVASWTASGTKGFSTDENLIFSYPIALQ